MSKFRLLNFTFLGMSILFSFFFGEPCAFPEESEPLNPWPAYQGFCGAFEITKKEWFPTAGMQWRSETLKLTSTLNQLALDCAEKIDKFNGETGRKFTDDFLEKSLWSIELGVQGGELDNFVDSEVLRITTKVAPLELNFLEFDCGKAFLDIKKEILSLISGLERETSNLMKACPAAAKLLPKREKKLQFASGSAKNKKLDGKNQKKSESTITGVDEDRKKRSMPAPGAEK